MLRIAFMSILDPESRLNFSGTLFYMLNSLQSLEDVSVSVLGKEFFGKQTRKGSLARILESLSRRSKLAKDLYAKYWDWALSRSIKDDLSKDKFDIIFAPVASRAIANYLPENSSHKIVFVTDATPKFIEQNYGWHVNQEAHQNEIVAIRKSSLVIYSSQYMADLAKNDYPHAFQGKTPMALSFGLNMDTAPHNHITKSGAITRLLFVGRFWERKGGDIAINCLENLLQIGINAHLTIVGCTPPNPVDKTYISVIPFLNKNHPKEQETFFKLLSDSHYLLLPTRADCTPMVIAEANAFSIPVLSTNVGGIPTLIDEGKNGFMFDTEDSAEVYSNKIAEIGKIDGESYKKLCKSSFDIYKTKLNWNAWATQLLEVIRNHLSTT